MYCMLHALIYTCFAALWKLCRSDLTAHFHPRNLMTSYPNEGNSSVNGQMGMIPFWAGVVQMDCSLPQPHPIVLASVTGQSSNSCRGASNKWLLEKPPKDVGRQSGCFMRARLLLAVIFSIPYPPLKISFTEMLVCIFIGISLKAKCFDFKSRKIECHSTPIRFLEYEKCKRVRGIKIRHSA